MIKFPKVSTANTLNAISFELAMHKKLADINSQ